ncbi:hypothetical protein [Actinomadura sp. 6N118]|uniref:hypothetical protein n=1 Tax=Actinomadura sp. 6N118 TaxID=3375151 RepID=UPI003796DD32
MFPTIILLVIPQGYGLDHHSGTKPRKFTPADNPHCARPPDCSFAFVWELPPGAVATTTFKVSKGFTEQPVNGFHGTVAVEKCKGARIGLALAGAGSASVTGSRFTDAPLKDLARGIPAKPTRLTFTLRRLDDRHCTAQLIWNGEGLSFDHIFKLRQTFRDDRPATG